MGVKVKLKRRDTDSVKIAKLEKLCKRQHKMIMDMNSDIDFLVQEVDRLHRTVHGTPMGMYHSVDATGTSGTMTGTTTTGIDWRP